MNTLLHPALPLLLRLQFNGRICGLSHSLLSRRNWVLTLVGVVLAVVWLGNAVASLLFRGPYDPETFHRAASLGMLGYVLWQVLRVSAKRPEHRIEWTPAERHFLLGGPFARRELVAYRLVKVLSTTVLKATCVSILFLPELRVWWIGFVGALLGFAFLEMLRLAVEFTACGVSRLAYLRTRTVVLAAAIALGSYALVRTVMMPNADQGPIAAWSLLRSFGLELSAFRGTIVGCWLESPFVVFANVLTSNGVSTQFYGSLLTAIALLGTAGILLFRLDAAFEAGQSGCEAAEHVPPRESSQPQMLARRVSIPRLGGIGPLAWRQFEGARGHLAGVLVALLAPTILACLPLSTTLDHATIFANVVGSIGFFSLVLLPSAFKFDFRRDFERLHVLKSLPFRPASVALGQIAVPVLLTSLYQVLVLAIAWWLQPISAAYVLIALACLLPANVMIYSIENTFFLISPHRMRQEGIEVFFKTTLIFTAKGLLFGGAAVVVFCWVFLAGVLGNAAAIDHRLLFVAGLSALAWVAAGLSVCVLSRVYQRMEAGVDCGT